MKIHHISDTHGYHSLLNIAEDVDMIIRSGDFTNFKDYYKNEPECLDFLNWFGALTNKYKVLIAGNHDAVPAISPAYFRDLCAERNITYLENELVEIEGIKIFGSPFTPSFGDWYFMKARHKIGEYWKLIPDDTDILVVHGAPKNILDLTFDRNGEIKMCGCKSLRNEILNRLNLKYCLFGHIHNYEDIINAGITKLSIKDTIFSNGSVVTDGKFGLLSSNGNIFTYEDRKGNSKPNS